MLGCVCNGGTLVMRGSDWERTIREVDVLICTPSILSRYSPEQFPNLRTVATAGEPISAKYVIPQYTAEMYSYGAGRCTNHMI